MEIRLSLDGLAPLQLALDAVGTDGLRREMRAAMLDSVRYVEGQAKTLAPRGKGALARSITSSVSGTTTVIGRVGTRLRYARWVEEGTGIYHVPDPHKPWVVRPVRAKALAIPAGGTYKSWPVLLSGGSGVHPFQAWKGDRRLGNRERLQDKKGRPLFRTPKGGSSFKEGNAAAVLFRQEVTIRGAKAQPFMSTALSASVDFIRDRFTQGLRSLSLQLKAGADGR